jgi:hypothetical protein
MRKRERDWDQRGEEGGGRWGGGKRKDWSYETRKFSFKTIKIKNK